MPVPVHRGRFSVPFLGEPVVNSYVVYTLVLVTIVVLVTLAVNAKVRHPLSASLIAFLVAPTAVCFLDFVKTAVTDRNYSAVSSLLYSAPISWCYFVVYSAPVVIITTFCVYMRRWSRR
jgi:hypothetical protein